MMTKNFVPLEAIADMVVEAIKCRSPRLSITGWSYRLCWEIADGAFEPGDLNVDLLYALITASDEPPRTSVWPDWLDELYDVIERGCADGQYPRPR